MAKKIGVNAKARKIAAESIQKEREAREKEDEFWLEAKSKAAKKKEEAAVKRTEAAAKKAEARRLAQLEETNLEKSLKKKKKKVTEAEMWRRREEEAAKKAEEIKKKLSRTVLEREYENTVLVENRNRQVLMVDAQSLEEALAQLAVSDHDRHPERRVKAAFKAFEEAQLPRLKEQKPGLAHTHYQGMIWKLWKKSQDNPLNRISCG